MVPLATPSLRKARLIKNVRLQGVVELFNDESTGSGQIEPDDLKLVFDFSGDRAGDLDIIENLSELPSYDVYSLRMSLRHLGIQVDNDEHLRLSKEKTDELGEHMRRFTQPLIIAVYGDKSTEASSFADVLRLFADPNVAGARDNLERLAKALKIELVEIPAFLSDYADIYLSLSYYRQCLEDIEPNLNELLASLTMLKLDPTVRNDPRVSQNIEQTAQKLRSIYSQAKGVIDTFEASTQDMWEDLNGERYKKMEEMIVGFQAKMGAGICAVTVKVYAWNQMFPSPAAGNVGEKVSFIVRSMPYGLDRIEPITFQDM
jgi:hypothetical protein